MKTADKASRSITACWSWTFGIATLALVVGWAATSQAAVNTVAWYRLGEDDPGAGTNLLGQNPTVDIGANRLNLTRFGNPTNRADTAVLSQGSTLSMQFQGTTYGGDGYATNIPATSAINNF